MKVIKLLSPYLLLFLLLAGCTTSNYKVSETTDISRYKYATISKIMDYTGAPVLMDMDIRVYDALVNAGLIAIGEKEIEALDENQKNQVLLVKYSASQTDAESIISISFIDYQTERPVAACRGAFGFGLTKQHDLEVATKRALTQMQMMLMASSN